MTAKEPFERWIAARREAHVPPSFADRVMAAVQRPSRRRGWIAQTGAWAAAAAIVLGMTILHGGVLLTLLFATVGVAQ
jgi:hypothetical protein